MKLWKLTIALLIASNAMAAKKLLIVDTANNDLYAYHRLEQMCVQAGFDTTAAHFYDLHNELTPYDAVILAICPTFLKNNSAPLARTTMLRIADFAQRSGKLLVLAFPGLSSSKEQAASIHDFLIALGLVEIAKSSDVNNYLALNLMKNINYSTSLEGIEKNEDAEGNDANILVRTNQAGQIEAGLLPLNSDFDAIKKKSFPIGLYLNNYEHNNHIVISRSATLLFNELSENFWINPVNPMLRSQLMAMEQQALNELNLLSSGKELSASTKADEDYAHEKERAQEKQILSSTSKIACAWLAPDAFDGDEILKKQIDNIAKANLNLLWFSFSPELYLSINASQPENAANSLKRIRSITHALKQKFHELRRPVPQIYIGVEITGNLRKTPVTEPMVDMYGTVYDKIPAPFDIAGFWKPELLDVFDQFVDLWEKDIGNGLPIAGVFFDFEMYHAQNQAGSYLPVADFSPSSMRFYQKSNAEPAVFAQTLMEQGKLGDYFCILKQQAYQLGRKIRNHIKARLPDAKMAAYFPNMPSDWFYLGLFSGLSTKKEPILLATFNNDIKAHQAWLVSNNIYCHHLAAMLLSKFRNTSSFNLIDEFNAEHDGIWYNRFSWLAHPYDAKAWWATESTPLDHDLVVREIGKHYPHQGIRVLPAHLRARARRSRSF